MLILTPYDKSNGAVEGAETPRGILPPQPKKAFTFITRPKVWHLNTRIYVRLLGPCFKTGRLRPFCQHLGCADGNTHRVKSQQRGTRISFFVQRYDVSGREPRRARTEHLSCLGRNHGIRKGCNTTRRKETHPSLVPQIEPMLTTRTNSATHQLKHTKEEALRSSKKCSEAYMDLIMEHVTLVTIASLSAISSTF